MAISWELDQALIRLSEELPAAIRELAKASARREPIIIMVPNNTSPDKLKDFAALLRDAMKT